MKQCEHVELSPETVNAYQEYAERHLHNRFQRVISLAEMVITLAKALRRERAEHTNGPAATEPS